MRIPVPIFVAAVAAFGSGECFAAAPAATALMNQYRCYVCHADTEPKAGPAFADVAAAYRGKPKAQSTVAAVIRRGQHGGGPWHMPPHPEISAAEANTIARYILALPLPADRAN